ncbi:unnamed protein product, partial [marine sediment metagenome]
MSQRLDLTPRQGEMSGVSLQTSEKRQDYYSDNS